MRPGSILLGSPGQAPSDRYAVAACPDCAWWAVLDYVPQSCPDDRRHHYPRPVRARVVCTAGCWDDWFLGLPECSAGHEVRVVEIEDVR